MIYYLLKRLKLMTLNPTTLPEIPVYRPNWDEFTKFPSCIDLIEEMGAHHVGLCKIIPPKEWKPRKEGYDNLDTFCVEKPISQITTGSLGIYLQNIDVRKSMSLKEFKKLSFTPLYRTPSYEDWDHLEKKYWSSISFCRPLYGANISGSITDSGQETWNIQKLDSILSFVFEQENIKIKGVNTPYLYIGMWRSSFPWHVEDVELYSINYLHHGFPKHWYVIPPAYARKFEAFVRGNCLPSDILQEHFRSEFLQCRYFLRHKSVLINPLVLAKAGIPTRKITQESNEIMITFPYAYHAGFNMGFNIAESTNFASPRWIEYGKKSSPCQCWDDTVKICMDPFVKRYQSHLYDFWLRGEDPISHPLDDYLPLPSSPHFSFKSFLSNITIATSESIQVPKSRLSIDSKKARKVEISSEESSFNKSDDSEFSPIKAISDSIISPGQTFLSPTQFRYPEKAIFHSRLPSYLSKYPKFIPLWCCEKRDINTERCYNIRMSKFEPYCCICAFIWTPKFYFGECRKTGF
ncbi:unnamed protein product [Protopolystoma xenopodis]|uniref:JmjC domain-containing protein n=1 Tax=Protopolystoma xenopodis TaxID=117903 RepID=A0A3S5AZ61_9PLAT|nr:unnamed protein product [Protopolystoma xenopodis]